MIRAIEHWLSEEEIVEEVFREIFFFSMLVYSDRTGLRGGKEDVLSDITHYFS